MPKYKSEIVNDSMNIIYQTSSEILPPCVATVGIFDGVHAGHRYLIEELKALAKSQKLKSVVITFAKHPRSVISPDFKPDLITTLDEKVAQIATTGVDTCIVLDFTFEMAQLSAYEFLNTILLNQYNVHTVPPIKYVPVSYTHLTLPTKRIV